jgi:DNA-binding PadR family transcriptional regulator
MATYSLINDRISLSPLDVHILVSLLDGRSNGYDLTRSSEIRQGITAPLNTSNTYKSLKSMQKLMLVVPIPSPTGDQRQKTIYRISSLGRMMLENEIAEQARFVSLAQSLLGGTRKS